MEKVDYLIVGGGVAGVTAAETIRENDSQSSVAIISDENEPLYSRIQLPHYLRSEFGLGGVYLRKWENYQQKNIQIFASKTASALDTKSRILTLDDGQKLIFSKLLIASGSKLNTLSLLGSNLKGVHYLRTITDANSILESMKEAKTAVVVGGGFIGLEFAHTFTTNNLKTTFLILEPYFWQRMWDETSGKLVEKILRENGVECLVNEETASLVGNERVDKLITKSGKTISTQIVGVGIGVRSSLEYLVGTSVNLEKNAALVNEYLETNVENIWAAGDITKFRDVILNKAHQMGNWRNAFAQGRRVGLNMIGQKEPFKQISAYTIKFFEATVSFVGDVFPRPEMQVISRGSFDYNAYGRILLKDNRVIGATLINLPTERSAIQQLIENNIEITSAKEKLGDLNFDLKGLVNGN